MSPLWLLPLALAGAAALVAARGARLASAEAARMRELTARISAERTRGDHLSLSGAPRPVLEPVSR